MIATTSGFSFWVNHFNNFNKIYGSLGTILILMFLIYLNSLILLIGFELNLSITFLKGHSGGQKIFAETEADYQPVTTIKLVNRANKTV